MYGYVCGGIEYNGYYTPCTQDSPRTSRKSAKKVVKYSNIQEQANFASKKYGEVLHQLMNTPFCNITPKLQEDVWAWGIFTDTVLPMLKFIDE